MFLFHSIPKYRNISFTHTDLGLVQYKISGTEKGGYISNSFEEPQVTQDQHDQLLNPASAKI